MPQPKILWIQPRSMWHLFCLNIIKAFWRIERRSGKKMLVYKCEVKLEWNVFVSNTNVFVLYLLILTAIIIIIPFMKNVVHHFKGMDKNYYGFFESVHFLIVTVLSFLFAILFLMFLFWHHHPSYYILSYIFPPISPRLCYPCSIKAIQNRHPLRASCVICQGDSNALFLFISKQCLHYQCVRCMVRQY